MKKVVRLFWSYNIRKTEQWLSDMAKDGYILKDVNTTTRIFTFEKGEASNLTYKICYEDDRVDDISPSLKKEGWKCIVKKGRWLFIENNKSYEDIKLKPWRLKLIKRNRFINKLMLPIMIAYGVTLFPMFIFLTILWLSFGSPMAITPEADPIIMLYFSQKYQSMLFVVFAFGLYSYIKLRNVNKDIRSDDGICDINIEEDDDLSTLQNPLIKRRSISWYYNQEKTVAWLNNMESQGYHLCKVNKSGNKFYFVKGEPRKIKYVIDYQGEFNPSYYEIHKEDGWKLRHKSSDEYDTWYLWCKEYESVEPEIYTDDIDRLDYAKKLLISHTVKFVPFILIGIFLICTSIDRDERKYMSALVYVICTLQYGKFYFDITRYYLRTKRG